MNGEEVRLLFQIASSCVLLFVLYVDFAIIRRIAPVAAKPDRPISKMVATLAALITAGAVFQLVAVLAARPFVIAPAPIVASCMVRVVIVALAMTIYVAGRMVFARQEPFFTRPVQERVAREVGVEPEQVAEIVRLFLTWPGGER